MGCGTTTSSSQVANSSLQQVKILIEIFYPQSCGWSRVAYGIYKKIEQRYPFLLVDCKVSEKEHQIINVFISKGEQSAKIYSGTKEDSLKDVGKIIAQVQQKLRQKNGQI